MDGIVLFIFMSLLTLFDVISQSDLFNKTSSTIKCNHLKETFVKSKQNQSFHMLVLSSADAETSLKLFVM